MATTTPQLRQPKRIRLAPRHRTFANEFLRTFNATRGAIKAGYSEQSAAVTGWRLLRNAKVKAYIDSRLLELELSRPEFLARISSLARVDLSQCIRSDGSIDYDAVKALGPALKSYSPPTPKRAARIEVHSALVAYELWAKARGLFRDDASNSPKISIAVQINGNPAGI
jgi:hypothetical protein